MKYRIISLFALAGVLFSSCVKENLPPEVGTIGGYIEGGESEDDPTPDPAPEQPEQVSGDYIDEYGINHGPGVKIGATVWAPVNCGYHATDYKYGKLYQWGRKYGQGYDDDATTPELVSGPVSLEKGQSEDNKNKFFRASVAPYDWLATQDGNLWNSGTEDNPVKTEYDPCPEGWRVPIKAELSELSQNYSSWTTDENGLSGRWFSGSEAYSASVPRVFLPASGGRLYNRVGSLSDVGSGGGYWSASPISGSAYLLSFYYYGGVEPSTSSGRASGKSVRCLQESK